MGPAAGVDASASMVLMLMMLMMLVFNALKSRGYLLIVEEKELRAARASSASKPVRNGVSGHNGSQAVARRVDWLLRCSWQHSVSTRDIFFDMKI